jgi:hypothetical protein
MSFSAIQRKYAIPQISAFASSKPEFLVMDERNLTCADGPYARKRDGG